MGENPAENLKAFIEKKGLVLDVLDKTGGLIPISRPLKNLCWQKTLLAGDAAFQTKASTGGGIIMGLKAANACAKTIVNHLKNNKSLSDYNSNIAEINKELSIHWKIHSYLNGLGNRQIDELFQKAKKAGIEEFLQEYGDMDNPSRFFGKVLGRPKLWGLLPTIWKIG